MTIRKKQNNWTNCKWKSDCVDITKKNTTRKRDYEILIGKNQKVARKIFKLMVQKMPSDSKKGYNEVDKNGGFFHTPSNRVQEFWQDEFKASLNKFIDKFPEYCARINRGKINVQG